MSDDAGLREEVARQMRLAGVYPNSMYGAVDTAISLVLAERKKWYASNRVIADLERQAKEFRDAEKEVSEAYMDIRKEVGAWKTAHGGADRFAVTLAAVRELKRQVREAEERADGKQRDMEALIKRIQQVERAERELIRHQGDAVKRAEAAEREVAAERENGHKWRGLFKQAQDDVADLERRAKSLESQARQSWAQAMDAERERDEMRRTWTDDDLDELIAMVEGGGVQGETLYQTLRSMLKYPAPAESADEVKA